MVMLTPISHLAQVNQHTHTHTTVVVQIIEFNCTHATAKASESYLCEFKRQLKKTM